MEWRQRPTLLATFVFCWPNALQKQVKGGKVDCGLMVWEGEWFGMCVVTWCAWTACTAESREPSPGDQTLTLKSTHIVGYLSSRPYIQRCLHPLQMEQTPSTWASGDALLPNTVLIEIRNPGVRQVTKVRYFSFAHWLPGDPCGGLVDMWVLT